MKKTTPSGFHGFLNQGSYILLHWEILHVDGELLSHGHGDGYRYGRGPVKGCHTCYRDSRCWLRDEVKCCGRRYRLFKIGGVSLHPSLGKLDCLPAQPPDASSVSPHAVPITLAGNKFPSLSSQLARHEHTPSTSSDGAKMADT